MYWEIKEPIPENEMIEEEEEIKINPYHDSKIYKIVSKNTDLIYVGSTTQTLKQRLKHHIYDYNRYKKGKHFYISSFKILEFGDYEIQLIKCVSVENLKELGKIEGDIMKLSLNNIVNKKIEGREKGETNKIYYNKNIVKIKKLRDENRDKKNEQNNEKFRCSCGGKFTRINKSTHHKTHQHIDYENSKK